MVLFCSWLNALHPLFTVHKYAPDVECLIVPDDIISI